MVSILTGADDKYGNFIGALIASTSKNTTEHLDIVVLDYGLTVETRQKILESVVHKEIHNIRFIDFSKDLRSKIPSTHILLNSPLFRAVFLPFIEFESSKIVYIDCDCIVDGDIGETKSINLNGKTFGAVPDPWFTFSWLQSRCVDVGKPYFNGGFLYIDIQKWVETKCSEKIVCALEQDSCDTTLFEQDIYNFAFTDDWHILGGKFNYLSDANLCKAIRNKEYASLYFDIGNKIVIHYAGSIKPDSIAYGMQYANKYGYYANLTPWNTQKFPLWKKAIFSPYIFIHKFGIPSKLWRYLYKYRLDQTFIVSFLRKINSFLKKQTSK